MYTHVYELWNHAIMYGNVYMTAIPWSLTLHSAIVDHSSFQPIMCPYHIGCVCFHRIAEHRLAHWRLLILLPGRLRGHCVTLKARFQFCVSIIEKIAHTCYNNVKLFFLRTLTGNLGFKIEFLLFNLCVECYEWPHCVGWCILHIFVYRYIYRSIHQASYSGVLPPPPPPPPPPKSLVDITKR